ncbi:restriction endonuclease subunit S [Acinetobacter oleivorans]
MSTNELPEGWIHTKLGKVVDYGKATKCNLEDVQPDTWVLELEDIEKGTSKLIQRIEASNRPFKSTKNVFKTGDVLYGKLRPYLNKVLVAETDGVCTTEIVPIDAEPFVNNRYLFYWFRGGQFLNYVEAVSYGVNMPRLGTKEGIDAPLVLAPIAEQKVIADKLDTLLAQVENIKARLERIHEILKQFRQSVLAAAVSGKLTEGWRRINTNHVKQDVYSIDKYWENEYKKNNKKYKKIEYPKSDFDLSAFPDSWVKTNVGRIFDVYVGATPSRQREDFWNGEINWVSSSEVAFCRIQSTKENITDEGYKSTSTTIHPIGTVMLAMIGQGKTRGQAAILDIEACHNQNTAALRIPEKIAKSEFLYFYLLYKYEETRQVGSGNNQQAMNKAIVQGLEFPLPPFKEQIEIVDKIESLFEYIERVEGQVQVALDRVNNLTQSILAKAFRGELTAEWREANPELISGENSAEVLLERIKSERSAKSVTKRGRGKA